MSVPKRPNLFFGGGGGSRRGLGVERTGNVGGIPLCRSYTTTTFQFYCRLCFRLKG